MKTNITPHSIPRS